MRAIKWISFSVVVAMAMFAFIVICGESDMAIVKLCLVKGMAFVILIIAILLGRLLHQNGLLPEWWYKRMEDCEDE